MYRILPFINTNHPWVYGCLLLLEAPFHPMCAVRSRSVVSSSLRSHGLQPARLLCPWGFSRPECWGGLPGPPPGDLPHPGIKPRSRALQANSLPSEPPGEPSTPCVVTEHQLPAFYSNFPPATYFTRASVRVSILSLHLPHPPLLPLRL